MESRCTTGNKMQMRLFQTCKLFSITVWPTASRFNRTLTKIIETLMKSNSLRSAHRALLNMTSVVVHFFLALCGNDQESRDL